MNPRILLVDDDAEMGAMLAARLQRRGYDAEARTSAAAALAAVRAAEWDVVATDLNMPSCSGVDLCRQVADLRPEVPVILFTAFGSLDAAIAGIRAGAYDFLTKPFDIETLALSLDRAVEHRRLRQRVRRLEEAVREHDSEILGESPAIRGVLDLVARVADTDATVLVIGDSGTGKELVARAIHRRSRRRNGPFVAVNCAALPEAILESELFGHVRGAFTDAQRARPGLFQAADGGTLFLDEIGDMPLLLQSRLLRTLQERTVRPVGGDAEVAVDVRVVAATHRDLDELVAAGKFRDDLRYRLDVLRVDVPPLRARGDDVLVLARRFLERFAAETGRAVRDISEPAARRLLAYAWPGNVRELENTVRRAVALATHETVGVEELPARIQAQADAVPVPEDAGDLVPLDEIERRYVQRVMTATGGNKRLAAKILGLDRKTLYRKLERWGAAGGPDED